MDTAEWIALVALLVAIFSIPVTIWATRRWGNRRASLQVRVEATPLLPSDTRPGLLQVTYRDFPVSDPHLVKVTIQNSGSRDVSSDMFDGGRPIVAKFNQTFYGLTSTEGGVHCAAPAIGAQADSAVVQLLPRLLKRFESWSFSAITTGPVQVEVDAPLIDADIQQAPSSEGSDHGVRLRLSVLGVTAEVPFRMPDRRTRH